MLRIDTACEELQCPLLYRQAPMVVFVDDARRTLSALPSGGPVLFVSAVSLMFSGPACDQDGG